MNKILLIEDERDIAELKRDYLETSYFLVEIQSDGKRAFEAVKQGQYDLIILDVMLPGLDGFQLCRKIRELTNIPILMVSAKQDDIDKIRALGLGADDYITKPFSPSELVARVKRHLRRYSELTTRSGSVADGDVIISGDLQLSIKTHRVFLKGAEINLPNKEFELLAFFMQHPEDVFSKDMLFERIWGLDAMGDTATISVHINRLCEKIETDAAKPVYI